MEWNALKLIGCIIAVCLIALVLWRNNPKRRRGDWEKAWLSAPLVPDDRCSHIDGDWRGTYDYAGNSPHKKLEPDSFSAHLNQFDGALNGEIKDSVGTSIVSGTIVYPRVRFKKTYVKGNDKCGNKHRTVYYEGTVAEDGLSAKGSWFKDPFNQVKWCGQWHMSKFESE